MLSHYITHWYANVLCRNDVTNSEEVFIYKERQSIDKSLFSEVSFSSSLKSPIIRCFGKANVFSDSDFSFLTSVI